VLIVATRVDADTTAIDLILRAVAADWGAHATVADAAGTGIGAGSAVCGIRGEIAAAVDRAAILDPYRAVGALTDTTPALDGHELTFANLAARSTIVHIGQKIHAGARA
jgi:hypothetical protein